MSASDSMNSLARRCIALLFVAALVSRSSGTPMAAFEGGGDGHLYRVSGALSLEAEIAVLSGLRVAMATYASNWMQTERNPTDEDLSDGGLTHSGEPNGEHVHEAFWADHAPAFPLVELGNFWSVDDTRFLDHGLRFDCSSGSRECDELSRVGYAFGSMAL